MTAFHRESKVLEMELSRRSDKIFSAKRSLMDLHVQKNINKLRLQAQNDNTLGTAYFDLNSRPELHCNGMDMHSVGNLLPSPDGYTDMELNKYFNFDSNVADNQREDSEAKQTQSLDDFFHDFQEIISSENKPITTTTTTIATTSITTTSRDRAHNNTSTNMVPYGDPSVAYNSTVSGVDFNLDLTQFYINTSEAEFLNADELKTDFSNGLIPFQAAQFTYHSETIDDSQEFSVIDLSTGRAEIYGKNAPDSCNSATVAVDSQPEFSAKGNSDQPKVVTDYSATKSKISVSTPMNQFYLDFKLNGETSTPSDADNSIVTYISKDALQSVEYINESGQTETVMYVDQQPGEKNDSDVTQYEIINFDDYQYHTENSAQLQHASELIPEINSVVPHYGASTDSTSPQMDILSTLLSDKSNKITIISKPMKNPKVRQSCDEFYLKFQEIDANPTKIAFAQQSKSKGCRKQKFVSINQIDLELVEPKPNRSARTIPTTLKKPSPPTTTETTTIPETPKLPSRFMRDRRGKMDVKRKRPRKLVWDSESDCENGTQPIKKSKSKF